VRMWYNH